MPDDAAGREAGAETDLKPSSQDGRDPAQPPAAVQVREVGHLDGPRSRSIERLPRGQGGRQGPGGAHPEPPSDGELVDQHQFEMPLRPGEQPAPHLLGNGERRAEVAGEREPAHAPRRPARARAHSER